MSSGFTFLKAIALLLFLGGIAAATYGVQSVVSPGGVAPTSAIGLRMDAVHPLLNATPGHQVTFDVLVSNNGDAARTVGVSVDGDGVKGTAPAALVEAGGNFTFFVTVDVPQGIAQGTHALRATIASPDGALSRARDDLVTLRILPPLPGYQPGASQATAMYVGRIAPTGRVFNTNDPALLALNFSRDAAYQPSSGLLPVNASIGLVDGFVEGVTGMQAGESRTFTFGPEKGYGNATRIEHHPRTETRERAYSLPARVESVPLASFESYIHDSKQGNASDYKVGDIFHFTQGANTWPYLIVSKNETALTYRLNVTVGQSYTLYPFWANASRVVAVNDSAVQFLTTPTTGPNQTFTYYSYWPNMTVASANGTSLLFRHDPPVGLKYTIPASQFQPATDAVVHEVDDTDIQVSVPSTNPLAGQTLTFDVYFASLTT